MSERDPVNVAMEHAASTLLLGIAFTGMNREEYLNWCGHARMVVEELRGLGVEINEGDEIAARDYPKQQSKSGSGPAALVLLAEWLDTEMDPEDDEYAPWMESFTARVRAALESHKPNSAED